jgi:hypothetical protein
MECIFQPDFSSMMVNKHSTDMSCTRDAFPSNDFMARLCIIEECNVGGHMTTSWRIIAPDPLLSTCATCACWWSEVSRVAFDSRFFVRQSFILPNPFLFLTSLAWRCENLFAPILRLPNHIPLITAPSLRWSLAMLAMGLIYSRTIIYFSLWQI